jgi:hypothetical protein
MRGKLMNAIQTASTVISDNAKVVEHQTALDVIVTELEAELSMLRNDPRLKAITKRTPMCGDTSGLCFFSEKGIHLWIRDDGAIVETPWTTLTKNDIKEVSAQRVIELCGPDAMQLMINAVEHVTKIHRDIQNYGNPSIEVVPGANGLGR